MSFDISHKDFPVGTVVMTSCDVTEYGATDKAVTEYRVTDKSVAVLFDNEGNVCGMVDNFGIAMSHINDGQGVALALKGDDFGSSIEDVQAQFDTARAHYVDNFGI